MKKLISSVFISMGLLLSPVYALAAEHGPVTFVKDSVITAKIKTKLAAEIPAAAVKLNVDTDDQGQVWLRGSVESADVADRAVEIARSTEGVKSVKSEIVIKRPAGNPGSSS
jgi:hyperosmotically inducible protein